MTLKILIGFISCSDECHELDLFLTCIQKLDSVERRVNKKFLFCSWWCMILGGYFPLLFWYNCNEQFTACMMQNCELCVQINFFPPTKNTVHKRKIIFLCLSKYFFLWAHSVISHDEDFFSGSGSNLLDAGPQGLEGSLLDNRDSKERVVLILVATSF